MVLLSEAVREIPADCFGDRDGSGSGEWAALCAGVGASGPRGAGGVRRRLRLGDDQPDALPCDLDVDPVSGRPFFAVELGGEGRAAFVLDEG
jgi:hypothetical protein